ncbi:MAG: NTP transferase domain-containing protein [Desulfobulbaceae bacterium]|jgi:mannose-1-phosphate guanylyltransferase|nr:NTP transferase domain-containing protein [Desulfobulbaceae bacterium]
MQAMILAAGFGTRLLPHSALRPKALFPVLNKPLLLATIDRLRRAGFDHIIVNAHHLRRQIGGALAGLPGVTVIEESDILGTGGGLRGALPLLRPEPLLVSNGDIYHLIDFADIYEQHCRAAVPVTMVMHDFPRFNKVSVTAGRVAAFDGPKEHGKLAFTGLHVIEPEMLRDIEVGVFSSIIDHYRQLRRQGVAIRCHDVTGIFWSDMGTEADYLALHAGLLRREIPCWPELGLPEGRQLIDRRAAIAETCRLDGWLAIGAAEISGDAVLARAVVWDGVTIDSGLWRDRLIARSPQKEGP